jgi:hypothetical protein
MELFVPAESALRKAVNEENGFPVGIAGLLHVELDAITTGYSIGFHASPPQLKPA